MYEVQTSHSFMLICFDVILFCESYFLIQLVIWKAFKKIVCHIWKAKTIVAYYKKSSVTCWNMWLTFSNQKEQWNWNNLQ